MTPDSAAQPSAPQLPQMSLPEVFALLGPDLEEIEARLSTIERPEIPMTAEIMDHVLALRGKRVRPLLMMLVARLGNADRDSVLWAATVIELIHTATLLHDDCLDGTTIRRGFPTVNHKWGQQAAILMGDYLFTKGFALLCEKNLHHALHVLTYHTHNMTCGMNREYAARFNADLTIDEYTRIVEEKTGALFISSCEIGAVLANLPEEVATNASEFGRELGYAFQVIDDIFDYTGDPAEIGKPVGTDFRTGFATLPLILSLDRGDPEVGKRVAETFRRGNASEEEWREAQQFVMNSGGLEAARESALAAAYSARERLEVLGTSPNAAPLFATVEYMIARGH